MSASLDGQPGTPPSIPGLAIDGIVAYPDDLARRYREAGYWTRQTHADLLRDAAADAPAGIALIDGDLEMTYADLAAAAASAATLLVRRHGIERGDRVIVQLPNCVDFVVAVFALFHLGAVPVFSLPAHRRRELDHFARISGATAIITRREIAGTDHAALAQGAVDGSPHMRGALIVDDVDGEPLLTALQAHEPAPLAEISPSDLAFLQLSGGTTGTPKLIPRLHEDYLYSVRESARICGLSERSRMLVAMPIAHNFTMSSPGILGVLHCRGTIVLTEDPSPARVLDLIGRHRVTIIPAVPALAISWMNAPEIAEADLASLEVLQVGGAKLSRAVAERIEPAFGCRLQQVFGMAEGLVNYTRLDDDLETIVSTQGLRISDADEVLVVDESDAPVPRGVPGSLLTRGPYTIRGYFRAPEHNARSFTADGFYRTGDLVVEREDGYLTVVGRTKDQINRGGEKIAPEEVENVLLAHPSVHDVSVTGIPDPVLGERTSAHVVLRAGAPRLRPVDLRRHLAAQGLAAYKTPDVFQFVDALPETGVGKVDRRRLSITEGEKA